MMKIIKRVQIMTSLFHTVVGSDGSSSEPGQASASTHAQTASTVHRSIFYYVNLH